MGVVDHSSLNILFRLTPLHYTAAFQGDQVRSRT